MLILTEVGIGGAGLSIVVGILRQGYLGTGFFAVQLAVTLSCVCLIPVLRRLAPHVPKVLKNVLLSGVVAVFVLPVAWHMLVNLFTGHRKPDSGPFDAMWRVFAITALWIVFAKVNEEYVRPALREVPFFSGASERSNSVSAQASRIAHSKRDKTLEDIKARLVPVIIRRKKAEKLIKEKEVELESAKSQAEKSQKLVDKKQNQLDTAKGQGSADVGDIEEELDNMAGMTKNSQMYLRALETHIEGAKNDIEECKVLSAKMQKEWTEALHIENHAGFYR